MSTHTQTKPAGTPTWFDLMTPDVAKARDFYEALFGWQYVVNGPEMGYYSLAKLKGQNVAGIGQIQPGSNMPSAWSVYLATDDIKADSEKAKQLGGQVMMEPMQISDEGWMVMIADPTGAVFGLWKSGKHIGATLTDEPGCMTWCEVNTRDAAKARDFYCNLYGLTWERVPGEMEYYVLKRGDANLAGVLQMDHNWPEVIPAHWMAYFAVADTDKAVKQAVQLGGRPVAETLDTPYGRVAALMDPFGATFTVVKLPTA
jgi:predicted enzyme related to lactoylglutathione lyase